MFENYKVFNYTLAGRPLVIETGKIAGLANGSCLVRYGETALSTVPSVLSSRRISATTLQSPSPLWRLTPTAHTKSQV